MGLFKPGAYVFFCMLFTQACSHSTISRVKTADSDECRGGRLISRFEGGQPLCENILAVPDDRVVMPSLYNLPANVSLTYFTVENNQLHLDEDNPDASSDQGLATAYDANFDGAHDIDELQIDPEGRRLMGILASIKD